MTYLWKYSQQLSLSGFSVKPMTIAYINPPFVYSDPEIAGFLSLHQHIQGKQRGWECGFMEDCEERFPLVGRFAYSGVLPLVIICVSLSLTHTRMHTHARTPCFDPLWTKQRLSPASYAVING